MFKNQTSFNDTNPNIQHQNLSQDKDLKIEDIPIYTMAKDLEEIEHPNVKNKTTDQKPLSIQIDEASLNEKQQSSPFFATSAANKITDSQTNIPISTKKTETKHSFWGSIFGSDDAQKEKEQRDEQKKIAEQKATEQRFADQKRREEEQRAQEAKRSAEQEELTARKSFPTSANTAPQNESSAIAIIISLLVLAIIGAGAYYYFLTRKVASTPATEPEVIIEKNIPETPTPPEAEEKPVFSIEKPNYLTINTTLTDSIKIRETIDEYAKNIKKSSVLTPIEFIVTDTKNNPVGFAMFSQKIGLALSKNTLANLADNFSLFIFNDSGNMRLGLAIDFIDSSKIKAALSKEEPELAKNLSAILLSTTYELPKATFGKSEYKNIAIKYQNITSPENLSIDYALTDKQLLIGTTKMTLRSIIDKLIPAKQVTQVENTTQTTSVTASTTAITE